MNKLFVYLLLVLPLVAVQCRKEEEPDLVPLPAGLKAYAYFLPGTYWIYRDSASGRLDSVWVTQARSSIRLTKSSGRVISRDEEMEVRMASNMQAGERVYKSQRICLSHSDSSSFSRSYNDVRPCWWVSKGAGQDETFVELLPYAPRWEHPEQLVGYFHTARAWRYRAPQRLVGGRVVGQVVEVSLTADLSEGGVPARYWWGKGLGVVQLRLYRPTGIQTRTLVRERIVQ